MMFDGVNPAFKRSACGGCFCAKSEPASCTKTDSACAVVLEGLVR